MSIYIRNAGPTILGLMSKAAELEGRRISLDNEIDLVRATLMRAVNVWNVALEHSDNDEMKLHAEKIIREASEVVARIVHTAAKVRILDQGALQMTSVAWVVGEVCRHIDEGVREQLGDEAAEEIINKIRGIKLPEDGTLAKFVQNQANEQFL